MLVTLIWYIPPLRRKCESQKIWYILSKMMFTNILVKLAVVKKMLVRDN